MKIELNNIRISSLVENYKDDCENGVVGYNGNLDIRPSYQREFVYKDEQRKAVIETVMRGYPLNVMYWSVNENGKYEVIDGQQRTLSICQYVNGDFSVGGRYFHNLHDDEKARIMNYSLQIYFCEGTTSEKLEWFKTINISGMQLTEQELRNAAYNGPWLADAKRYFSKNGCAAYKMASDYMSGSPIRQDYLETALKWISGGRIEDYMAAHQNDPSAGELWRYFTSVVMWIETTFSKKRPKLMKGVEWGLLYNDYQDKVLHPNETEEKIKKLLLDDDVTSQKGIYSYLITGHEKFLSIRKFSDNMKITAYERQNGICPICGERHDISNMEGDHITPWSEGGKTTADNCQMLCKECNRRKSNK